MSDPRSNERFRRVVLDQMADGGWYKARDVALARPETGIQIESAEWELQLLEIAGQAERGERGWRLRQNGP
jgi:hypothetical protein